VKILMSGEYVVGERPRCLCHQSSRKAEENTTNLRNIITGLRFESGTFQMQV
jgi:hypothetical protein